MHPNLHPNLVRTNSMPNIAKKFGIYLLLYYIIFRDMTISWLLRAQILKVSSSLIQPSLSVCQILSLRDQFVSKIITYLIQNRLKFELCKVMFV